jgi:hypothetical protein
VAGLKAHSLALKTIDVVKAAKGTPLPEGTMPTAPIGVVLMMRNPETDFACAINGKSAGRSCRHVSPL